MSASTQKDSSEKAAEMKKEDRHLWMKRFAPDKNYEFVGRNIRNERKVDKRIECELYGISCMYATIEHYCDSMCPMRRMEEIYRGISDE